jgi:hypothetical protein
VHEGVSAASEQQLLGACIEGGYPGAPRGVVDLQDDGTRLSGQRPPRQKIPTHAAVTVDYVWTASTQEQRQFQGSTKAAGTRRRRTLHEEAVKDEIVPELFEMVLLGWRAGRADVHFKQLAINLLEQRAGYPWNAARWRKTPHELENPQSAVQPV